MGVTAAIVIHTIVMPVMCLALSVISLLQAEVERDSAKKIAVVNKCLNRAIILMSISFSMVLYYAVGVVFKWMTGTGW